MLRSLECASKTLLAPNTYKAGGKFGCTSVVSDYDQCLYLLQAALLLIGHNHNCHVPHAATPST